MVKYLEYRISIVLFLSIIFNSCDRQENIVQVDDGVPPAVPTQFSVFFAGDGEVVLQWRHNSESDFDKYKVYRRVANNVFDLVGETRNNIFIDDSLLYNQEYFYRISAVDISGKESSLSGIVSATPINKNPPSAPRGFQINARNWVGKKSFYLNWFKNKESDINGYKIYRSDKTGFTADSNSFVGFATGMDFNDTSSFTFYKDYFYRIKAVDKGGLESNETNEFKDQILEIPEIVFPLDNSQINQINNFIIKALPRPAQYKIIVQTNEFFGEFWSTQFSSEKTTDTLQVPFTPIFLNAGIYYYWRVATFTNGNSLPNSISRLYKFFLTSEFL